MIVPMKKATILVSANAQKAAVSELRRLGVLHVKHVNSPQSGDLDTLQAETTRVQRALFLLEEARPSDQADQSGGRESMQALLDKVAEKDHIAVQLQEKRETRSWFDIWGPVSLSSVQDLAKCGLGMRCYRTDKVGLKQAPEGLNIHVLGEEKGTVFAVLFSETGEDKLETKEDVMPQVEVSTLDSEIQSLQDRLEVLQTEISGFVNKKPAIEKYAESLQKELEYQNVLSGLGKAEGLVFLQGYVPEEKVEALNETAQKEGWGTVIEEPDNPAEVPTLLRNGKIPRIIEPLFKFMGTLPGYHEVDVSFVFLLFFSLFYAMIIGDAGYGLVFLVGTAFARSKNKSAPVEPFALFYVLSVATIIWGALTGTWFGSRAIAEWGPLRSLVIEPMFSFNESKESTLFMMRFAFFLGLIQLMLAHFMAFLKKLPSIKAVAQLGWVLICAGMFFVVDLLVLSNPFPAFARMLIIAGLVLVGLFTNFQKNPLKLLGGFVGSILGAIQDVISAFSDIVSYIRLFAVGLAGVTVAASFNDMAGGIMAPLVLVLGHGLNIILGLMSVMVHGVRLNMLEFSGHLGQEWTGSAYEPFKDKQ